MIERTHPCPSQEGNEEKETITPVQFPKCGTLLLAAEIVMCDGSIVRNSKCLNCGYAKTEYIKTDDYFPENKNE